MKNNIDVFYFSCLIPLHVLFVEDGKMGKKQFFMLPGVRGNLILELGNLIMDVSDTSGIGVGVFLVFIILS